MNKKLLIILLVAILSAGVYFYYSKKSEQGFSTFRGTWEELAERGGNYHCRYSFNYEEVDGGQGGETVYIFGDKARRVTVSSNAFGGVYSDENILKDGNNLYKWRETTNFGFDGSEPTEKLEVFIGEFIIHESKKDDENNFQCKEWNPDPSLFVLPEEVRQGVEGIPRWEYVLISEKPYKVPEIRY